MTLDDDDCYALFLIVDSCARVCEGKDEFINRMREKLLPVYRDWHKANPGQIHPISLARVKVR